MVDMYQIFWQNKKSNHAEKCPSESSPDKNMPVLYAPELEFFRENICIIYGR